MSTDTPAAGGEHKPVVKSEGKSPHHGGRNNANKNIFIKKEKFLGADPNLRGKIFEAKRNRSDQVANFNAIDELIKAQIGAECDPYVLESLEKETLTLPSEPTPVYETKKAENDPEVMSELEKMKFKSKFEKFLARSDKVEMQLKQVFSKYFGQIDEDMKGSLKEDSDYEQAFHEKDVIALRKNTQIRQLQLQEESRSHQNSVAS